jgi:hypothetical protein
MPTPRLPESVVAETLEQVKKHGSITAAAAAMGVPRNTIDSRMRRAREIGLEIPKKVYATSTLIRGEEGDGFALQWVKAKAEEETREQIIEAFKEELKGLKPLPPIKAPKQTFSDLLAVYPMGDPHFGQYSWAAETGDDYDLDLAEKLHVSAMDHLVSLVPPAESSLIVNVGDFFHGNDSKNQTPQSKPALDVDTRHAKVVRSGLRSLRRMIERALEKHRTVKLISVPGNHDPEASILLPIALGMLYEKNPRVTIEDSPSKFLYHRHGLVLIGVTHGDTVKVEKLGELMAADQRELWGQTEFHHWITGHWHHKRFHEGVGFTAEVLRTLAGKDAYAASHAYRSDRDMQVILFDKKNGETGRHRVGVKQLEKRAA